MQIQLDAGSDKDVIQAIRANRITAKREGYGVVGPPRACRQRHVLICGSGPSLATEESRHILQSHRGHIWACNWSLQYLIAQKFRVTHGVAVDGTRGMLRDWPQRYDVRYLLASCVHPDLVASLAGASVTFFHSFRGFDGELALYKKEWDPSVQVGAGLTVVTRAICLALWLGYHRITVIGNDCALGPHDAVRPNGQTPKEAYQGNPLVVRGYIGHRQWSTIPDLLFDATAQRTLAKHYPHVRLRGDTLPQALVGWSPQKMRRLIDLDEHGTITTQFQDDRLVLKYG